MRYEIRDWMNNLLFGGQTFPSFEDGWGHIYENVSDEDNAYDEYFVYPTKESARLEYLRGQIQAECISWGELHELQGLVGYIDPGDVELLEWAGVPETCPETLTGEHDARPYTEAKGSYCRWCEAELPAIS